MKKKLIIATSLVLIVLVVFYLGTRNQQAPAITKQQKKQPEASPFAVKYRQAQLEQQGLSTDDARRQAVLDILRGAG